MTDISADRNYAARISACPACDAAPLAARIAGDAATRGDLVLSLPTAHCATCISDVERALLAQPGVRAARVNLTLRRVMIDAPGQSAEDLIPVPCHPDSLAMAYALKLDDRLLPLTGCKAA